MAEDIVTVSSAEATAYLRQRVSGSDRPARWRTQSQRDYDRILYSSAFQRLGAITQVTASEVGRPFHTRLTHTLKVAQVARRSAERLRAMLERPGLWRARPDELSKRSMSTPRRPPPSATISGIRRSDT